MTRPLSTDQWEMKRLAQQQVRLLTQIRRAQQKVAVAQAAANDLLKQYATLEQQEQDLRGRLAGIPESDEQKRVRLQREFDEIEAKINDCGVRMAPESEVVPLIQRRKVLAAALTAPVDTAQNQG